MQPGLHIGFGMPGKACVLNHEEGGLHLGHEVEKQRRLAVDMVVERGLADPHAVGDLRERSGFIALAREQREGSRLDTFGGRCGSVIHRAHSSLTQPIDRT